MINLPLNVDFSGKVVVVTGAGGILMSEFAKALAQSGAKVALLDINEEAVKAVAADIGDVRWSGNHPRLHRLPEKQPRSRCDVGCTCRH